MPKREPPRGRLLAMVALPALPLGIPVLEPVEALAQLEALGLANPQEGTDAHIGASET